MECRRHDHADGSIPSSQLDHALGEYTIHVQLAADGKAIGASPLVEIETIDDTVASRECLLVRRPRVRHGRIIEQPVLDPPYSSVIARIEDGQIERSQKGRHVWLYN